MHVIRIIPSIFRCGLSNSKVLAAARFLLLMADAWKKEFTTRQLALIAEHTIEKKSWKEELTSRQLALIEQHTIEKNRGNTTCTRTSMEQYIAPFTAGSEFGGSSISTGIAGKVDGEASNEAVAASATSSTDMPMRVRDANVHTAAETTHSEDNVVHQNPRVHQVLTPDQLYNMAMVDLKEFLSPQLLAWHTIEDVQLGLRFNESLHVDDEAMSRNFITSALTSFATHPDQIVFRCVKKHLLRKLNIDVSIFDAIASYLQVALDKKEALRVALSLGSDHCARAAHRTHCFLMRVAACFADATGLEPFSFEVLKTACGIDNSFYGKLIHLIMARIALVYWFKQDLGAIHDNYRPFIVSGVLGQLSNGHFFFYRDACPSLTSASKPAFAARERRPSDVTGGPFLEIGGTFHADYVAIVAQDFPSLLRQMRRSDVDAVVMAIPTIQNIVNKRADKLRELFRVLEFDPRHTVLHSETQMCEHLVEPCLHAVQAQSALEGCAFTTDPRELWQLLRKVKAVDLLCSYQKAGISLQPWRRIRTTDLVALRNCLRSFHSAPRVPIDVPLTELRYTKCSISAVFGSGVRKGVSLDDTVAELTSGFLSPQCDIMILNVALFKGKYFAMNNRKLWCLRQLSLNRPNAFARVLVWPLARGVTIHGVEVCEKFCRNFTTIDDGVSVVVRHSIVSKQSC